MLGLLEDATGLQELLDVTNLVFNGKVIFSLSLFASLSSATGCPNRQICFFCGVLFLEEGVGMGQERQ